MQPQAKKKPEVAEVYDFLSKHHALIVHFSGAPKGAGVDRGSAHLFPADLKFVVDGHAMGGISCSTVKPGDTFHGFERNATGCIGVVIGLQHKQSLVAVDPADCGSIENKEGFREVREDKDIGVAELAKTIEDRTFYNEWVIKEYTALGIFAAPPYEASITQVPVYPDDMPEHLRDNRPAPNFRTVNFQELARTFLDLPIYTFTEGNVRKYNDGNFFDVDHLEIYKAPR